MRRLPLDRARHVTGWAWVLATLAAVSVATCSEHLLPSSPAPAAATVPGPATQTEAAAQSLGAIRGRFPGVIAAAAVDGFDVAGSGSLAPRYRQGSKAAPATAVELPADAAGPVRVTDRRSGMAVTFALEGASHAAPVVASGYALYPGAAPSGGDVIHRVHPLGDEDFVYFARAPERAALRYHVDVGLAAGLRVIDDVLELLDAGGAPRLRVAPPVVIDASGKRLRAALSIEGCAADTSPRAPWGRPVTPPGAASCVVVVSWPESVRYPVLVDPSWQTTASMVVARWGHAVAALPSLTVPPTLAYRVLVTGGFDQTNTPLASAEIYEPLSQTFTLTSSMHVARAGHTATPIPGSSTGRILIAGTAGAVLDPTPPEHLTVTSSVSSSSTEVYDEIAGTFITGPPMSSARFFHTATALVDGRILLVGGTSDTAAAPTTSADLFTADASSPTGGTIAAANGAMHAARFGHAAALLTTGAVLVTGGVGAAGAALASAETFCPINDCAAFGSVDIFVNTTTSMAAARAFHTATGLHTGDVLLAGGIGSYGAAPTYLATAELFTIGSFQGTLVPMAHPRAFHSATKFAPLLVLADGSNTALAEVLLTGGFDSNADMAAAEAYFPAAGSAPQAVQPVPDAAVTRRHATAILVNDGANVGAGNGVLVMGGISGSTTAGAFSNGLPTQSAELFLKIIGDACNSDGECLTGHCADGFCCDTACGTDCFSCAASLKQDGSNDGICGPSTAGLLVSIDCVPGGELEVHSRCDGQGHAKPAADSIDCKPSTCGANNRCSTFCDDGANQCSPSGWCNFAIPPDGGVPDAGGPDDGGDEGGEGGTDAGPATMVGTCQAKGTPGAACTADGQCLSGTFNGMTLPGICVDGFCCDTTCTDQCQACNVPGVEGICTTLGQKAAEPPHLGGLHPRMDCLGVPTLCGGLCNGNALACAYPEGVTGDGGVDPTQVLQKPDCTEVDGGDTFVSYPCDGNGGHTKVTSDCGGFQCLDAHTCRTTCAQDTDCIQDHICAAGGVCQILPGPLCDGDVTLRQPVEQGGNVVCPDHYACPAGATACNTSCEAFTDCASGFVCDDTSTCVDPLSAPALRSCAITAPARDSGGEVPSASALALVALALVRRRRRSPCPR